jgi:pimeloyl-ACP methyl ester carboxylesterase
LSRSEKRTVIACDGVEIAASLDGHGPAVIMLHGITEDQQTWQRFVAPLSRQATVVRLDFRGHGRSQRVETANYDDLVNDVTAVVNALGLDQPIYVGHSLGGVIASYCAADYGASAVLCLDQCLSVKGFQPVLLKHRKRLQSQQFHQALIDEANELGLQLVPEFEREQLLDYRRQASQDLTLSLWQPLLERSAQSIDRERALRLKPLKCPYFAIHGEPLEQAYINWLKRVIAHAKIEVIANHGHWPQHVAPEWFERRLEKLLL